eukprot:7391466-Prymnesium_polylepis.2
MSAWYTVWQSTHVAFNASPLITPSRVRTLSALPLECARAAAARRDGAASPRPQLGITAIRRRPRSDRRGRRAETRQARCGRRERRARAAAPPHGPRDASDRGGPPRRRTATAKHRRWPAAPPRSAGSGCAAVGRRPWSVSATCAIALSGVRLFFLSLRNS